jgi:hypothetical protein
MTRTKKSSFVFVLHVYVSADVAIMNDGQFYLKWAKSLSSRIESGL